jgi:hypothetical protein
VRVRTRGQGLRQGGEGLGVQRAWQRMGQGRRLSGARGRAAEEREKGEREREKGKRKKKRKEKGREKEKEKEREIAPAPIAATTATARARALVGRDARDKGEQGDGTAMDSDVGTGFSGDWEIGRKNDLSSTMTIILKHFSA